MRSRGFGHTDDDFMGSPNEFVRMIDAQWHQRKLNELQKLESELGCNLIESLLNSKNN